MQILKSIRAFLFGESKPTSLLDPQSFEHPPVVKRYVNTGIRLGEIISDRYMGHDLSYEVTLNSLIKQEKEIVAMGYRAVPIGLFTQIENPEDLLMPFRETNEEPILFALIWKHRYSADDIFSNEKMFCNERKIDDMIVLEVNPESRELFKHETVLLELGSKH